jgi:hypothetical protein
MASPGYFRQFLLAPSNVPPDVGAAIEETINAIAEKFDEIARDNKVDPRFLAFRRPVYMVVAAAPEAFYVLYSNEKAVRGTTQWWFLD